MADMAEVLDLRQFRCAQLDPLLAAETEEWRRVLNWDYASSAELIRQYIEARILPGYVLVERARGRSTPQGYGFFIYEARKGMIGNLFVLPAHRGLDHAYERRLLAHMIETLQATPGLERIEAQLMPFAPAALASSFAAEGFESFRRVFLEIDFEVAHHGAGAAPAPPSGFRIEPWGRASYEEAARLILHAYQGHVDSRINDQYRSFSGAMRFMHNIAHYPGCGLFDASASFIVRSTATGELEGMVLTSRIRDEVSHITQVCIRPEHQQRGLGRALVTQCLSELRRQGMRSASLTVTGQNTTARTLYHRLGFAARSEFDAYVWDRSECAARSPSPHPGALHGS